MITVQVRSSGSGPREVLCMFFFLLFIAHQKMSHWRGRYGRACGKYY